MDPFQVPIRLLLVDDETEFRDSTARALRRRDFEVTTAQDGETALAVLSAEGFDVVVLDVKMPGLDGLEVIGQLKNDRAEIQVILLTGHGSSEDAARGIEAGAFDYLIKPVDIDELIDIIHKAAGR